MDINSIYTYEVSWSDNQISLIGMNCICNIGLSYTYLLNALIWSLMHLLVGLALRFRDCKFE